MRHRPRPALVAIGLVALAIFAFIDFQGSHFFRDFKAKSLVMIKEKIGLDGEIGNVEGGIFRGVVLKDVKLYGISSSQDKKIFFSSAAIDLNYRLWDIALGKYEKLARITFISPKVFFFDAEKRLPKIPKIFEPEWKEITVSVKDGSLYNAQKIPVIAELDGNFRLSEREIESQSVSANVLGQRFSGKGSMGFPIERSTVKFGGSIKGHGYALRAQLDGVLDRIFVHGSFDIFDKLNLNFAGNVAASGGMLSFNDFRFGPNFILSGLFQPAEKGFNMAVYPEDVSGNATAMGEVSKLSISGDFAKVPYFTLTMNANHLKMFGFDLLSNYKINGKLNYDNNGKLSYVNGDFGTSGSLINYDPVREIKGAYELREGALKLSGVNYGDVVYANGYMGIGGKNDIDLHFKFKGAQLGGLADLAIEKGTISGLVFGDVNIQGGLGRDLKIDGQIELIKGNISMIRYNSAKITLKGNGSALEFIDSKVYTDDSVLTLEGKMYLRDMGTPRIFRNIVIKSDPNTIVWAGESAVKMPAGEEYVAGENVNERFRVNFRNYESQQGSQLPRQETADPDYRSGGQTSTKLKMKENEDFFGVERKVKF